MEASYWILQNLPLMSRPLPGLLTLTGSNKMILWIFKVIHRKWGIRVNQGLPAE